MIINSVAKSWYEIDIVCNSCLSMKAQASR